MNKEIESKLKSIEYHLEVATDGANNSALVVHHAQADLIRDDVPYLLELVRSQAEELTAKTQALKSVERITNRFMHGELVNEGDGILWREPVEPLPRGTVEIHEIVEAGLR